LCVFIGWWLYDADNPVCGLCAGPPADKFMWRTGGVTSFKMKGPLENSNGRCRQDDDQRNFQVVVSTRFFII
jgi:hypothetical protein